MFFSVLLFIAGDPCTRLYLVELWEGAGSGTVVYKTSGFTRAPMRRQWRKSTLYFSSPLSSRPPVCPVPLETCLRTSNQLWTPRRWGSDDPSPCWRQEETLRVSRGMRLCFILSIKWFSVEGGKTIRQHLLLMCLITETQQAVEVLVSLCLVDANRVSFYALTAQHFK